jgi:hypothetical protein
MFFFQPHFYYIVLALQAICVIHYLRRGSQSNWIWLIIFLPLIGCILYIFTEIIKGGDIRNMQSGLGSLFNPSGRISTLEENLRFADSFNNRVLLADAYLNAGQTDKAISLYESSLTGAFDENEHVLAQLSIAYFSKERYADMLPLAKKVVRLPQFIRSRVHIQYALALEYTGKPDLAEQEFKTMKGRYANFESRYEYGRFLLRAGRTDEAIRLYKEITDEASYLGSRERRANRVWIAKSKEELKKATAPAA